MKHQQNKYQVAIVGGGPVGLFLGYCLHEGGISCTVLEQREAPITHSRSIGIHPVSLERFKTIGLADSLIEKGVKVKEGHAYWESQKVGTLSFASCPPPYPFILTLPQFKTERLLSAHLNQRDPSILQRNTKVTGIEEDAGAVQLHIMQKGEHKIISANYVVGCDGMNSFVRKAVSIPFPGKTYKDTYIMGDFSDNTTFKSAAAIFLGSEGLIESFPLSDNKRRWVVKTDHYYPKVNRTDIEQRINRRIDFQLNDTENYMLSSFGVLKKQAERMVKDRIILAGDSAHIVNPIGGQGMNLGWLDAYDLSQCFQQIFRDEAELAKVLKAYSARRLGIAKKAARRAEFNMALGRKTAFPPIKKMILWAITKTPLSKLMARLFTMRGLEN